MLTPERKKNGWMGKPERKTGFTQRPDPERGEQYEKPEDSAVVCSDGRVAAVGISGTLAYLSDRSLTVVNTFLPGQVPPEIGEEFNGLVKENVRVKNQGNVPAYVRCAVIVSWKDAQGDMAPEVPVKDVDYTLQFSDEGWKKQGGYYYCLQEIGPGEETPVLIREVKQISCPKGYALVVEILSQTIQADGLDVEGRKPILLAWGVDITDGTLIVGSGRDGG